MGAPVLHFEIMGGSGNQLEEFYTKLFGWTIDSNNPMNYGMVTTGGQGGINGGVGPAAPEQGQGSRVTVYAQVDDIAGTLKKAEGLGAKVIMPETEVPGGPTIGMFADPAGNVTGLMKGM
jgi:uncharacterized protein